MSTHPLFHSADEPMKHDKYAAYNKSDKGQGRKVSYESKRPDRKQALNASARARTLQRYLSREFVAWDGEGVNEPDGSHTYVLLACSDGPSLSNRAGLSTTEVLELFLEARTGVTHIGYGLGYDINMILRDLDRESLESLYHDGMVKWNGYLLSWRPGKSFAVRTQSRKFLIYDVLPFFQRSFVSACDEYLGTDWPHRDEIIREKANRGSFDYDNIGVISDYNNAELATLVRLANELRERLHRASIRVKRWDGPGAIASALYQKHGTKSSLSEAPTQVATAARHAYAGGRFETIRKGHSDRPCFQYDIRSAYPSAMRYLPCLSHGQWTHHVNPAHVAGYGVYRIEVTKPLTESRTQPNPLWTRSRQGTVEFRRTVHGWYWTPEARLVIGKPGVVIHEGWVLETQCDCDPFSFVEPLYNKRAALKKAGDGAHVAYKLGLNSLYGKLAQQVGWTPGPPLKIPPYHSLEWAGYVTSHCRAQVYQASTLAVDDVISFETDAVFSRVPLELAIGSKLGEWDRTDYQSLTYLKSGMYYGTLDDGTEVEKTRGINKGTLPRHVVSNALRHEPQCACNGRCEHAHVAAESTRFVTLGQALHQNFDHWRHWITAPRNIQVALQGKRMDILDSTHVWKDTGDGWGETEDGVFTDVGEFSYPYEVEWINPASQHDPSGRTLRELRALDNDNGWRLDYE